MCTAICSSGKYAFFGRTLDLEYSYGESIILIPRHFCLNFRYTGAVKDHFSIVGIGIFENETPLFYDAQNECGLAMAALNFPDLAHYGMPISEKSNVASFEVIPWVLSRCKNICEAKELLEKTNVTGDSFSEKLKATSLHWIISDRSGSLTLECNAQGVEIYENSFGVLTNAPPFPYHEWHIRDYLALSDNDPEATLFSQIKSKPYSRGMGAIGLPGDFSSASRFVKAYFVKEATDEAESREEAINRFFHMTDSVSVPKGCIKTAEGNSVFTVYASMADIDTMDYCFVTYSSRKIRCFRVSEEMKAGINPTCIPISDEKSFVIL